jgi:hypothetical protein
MKKELINHLLALIIFFALITLLKRWFTSPIYLLFWAGGLIGTFLPDLDHLVYVYISRPNELTSQRVASLFNQKQYASAFDLLNKTRYERTMPIFHTILFQVVFAVVAFFLNSSSASLFGTGLVLAILIHLWLDQVQDFFKFGHINNWINNLTFNFNHKNSSFFIFINSIFICLLILIT